MAPHSQLQISNRGDSQHYHIQQQQPRPQQQQRQQQQSAGGGGGNSHLQLQAVMSLKGTTGGGGRSSHHHQSFVVSGDDSPWYRIKHIGKKKRWREKEKNLKREKHLEKWGKTHGGFRGRWDKGQNLRGSRGGEGEGVDAIMAFMLDGETGTGAAGGGGGGYIGGGLGLGLSDHSSPLSSPSSASSASSESLLQTFDATATSSTSSISATDNVVPPDNDGEVLYSSYSSKVAGNGSSSGGGGGGGGGNDRRMNGKKENNRLYSKSRKHRFSPSYQQHHQQHQYHYLHQNGDSSAASPASSTSSASYWDGTYSPTSSPSSSSVTVSFDLTIGAVPSLPTLYESAFKEKLPSLARKSSKTKMLSSLGSSSSLVSSSSSRQLLQNSQPAAVTTPPLSGDAIIHALFYALFGNRKIKSMSSPVVTECKHESYGGSWDDADDDDDDEEEDEEVEADDDDDDDDVLGGGIGVNGRSRSGRQQQHHQQQQQLVEEEEEVDEAGIKRGLVSMFTVRAVDYACQNTSDGPAVLQQYVDANVVYRLVGDLRFEDERLPSTRLRIAMAVYGHCPHLRLHMLRAIAMAAHDRLQSCRAVEQQACGMEKLTHVEASSQSASSSSANGRHHHHHRGRDQAQTLLDFLQWCLNSLVVDFAPLPPPPLPPASSSSSSSCFSEWQSHSQPVFQAVVEQEQQREVGAFLEADGYSLGEKEGGSGVSMNGGDISSVGGSDGGGGGGNSVVHVGSVDDGDEIGKEGEEVQEVAMVAVQVEVVDEECDMDIAVSSPTEVVQVGASGELMATPSQKSYGYGGGSSGGGSSDVAGVDLSSMRVVVEEEDEDHHTVVKDMTSSSHGGSTGSGGGGGGGSALSIIALGDAAPSPLVIAEADRCQSASAASLVSPPSPPPLSPSSAPTYPSAAAASSASSSSATPSALGFTSALGFAPAASSTSSSSDYSPSPVYRGADVAEDYRLWPANDFGVALQECTRAISALIKGHGSRVSSNTDDELLQLEKAVSSVLYIYPKSSIQLTRQLLRSWPRGDSGREAAALQLLGVLLTSVAPFPLQQPGSSLHISVMRRLCRCMCCSHVKTVQLAIALVQHDYILVAWLASYPALMSMVKTALAQNRSHWSTTVQELSEQLFDSLLDLC